VNDLDETASSPPSQAIEATMPPSKKPGWIAWRSCAARAIIMEDLLPGGVLFERDTVSAELLLPWYQDKYPQQFSIVVVDQFIPRLKDHRKQASEEYAVAQQEEEYFAHDRKCYPRKTHNERGEPVFDMSPAKQLLRQDIKDEMHIHYKTSKQLQLSRTEYKPFKPRVFQDRILQAIRLRKYIHYLELKRAKLLAPPQPKATPKKKMTGKRKK
jgi:hypothetical protein